MKIQSFPKPFPHFVIKHFLPEEKTIEILKALLKQEFSLKNSDLFTFLQTHDLKTTNNEAIQQFKDLLTSDEFIKQLESTTNIKLTKHIDLFGSVYKNTHHLLPHDDQLESRKIAYIYYLSTLEKEDGGALALYNSKNAKPTNVAKRLVPEYNTFTFFIVSPESFHQVEEVLQDKQRIAITGWFH